MSIYIYNGYGAWPTGVKTLLFMFSMTLHPHGIPIKTISQNELNDPASKWQDDADLLVFGGGEFSKVKEKLSSYGRAAIQAFTSEKSYLGICKGAYAGAAQIDFFGKNDRKQSPGFGFFNGVARGSLPIAPSLYSGKSDSAQIVTLRHELRGLEFPALYWGGPCFNVDEDDSGRTQKLVTLKTPLADREITMGIKTRVGERGQALLLGYHAEAIPSCIDRWIIPFCDNPGDITRIRNEINAHQPWTFYLGFASLLDDLQIVRGHSFLNQILHPESSAAHSNIMLRAFSSPSPK